MRKGSAQPPTPLALCPECQAGAMHLRYITYFTWLNQELITAPNFPAWICDYCGRREYDRRAVRRLNTLLSPETSKPAVWHRKSGTSRMDRPQP